MDLNSVKKKYVGLTFFAYMGIFFGWVNLYLNDKLRADMEKIEKNGNKKEKLKEIHQRNASSYEKKTNFFEFRNQINKYRRVLLSWAKGNVLEVGVGTGRSLEYYKRDVNELVGIDYSSKMLEQAIEKLENKEEFRIGDLNAKFSVMDAEKMTFDDNSFDCVVDFLNMHCYNDYELVIKNIKRVLKDKGTFIVLARGESSYFLIKDFYKIFKPFFFMKHGFN
jgi:ubiquinone/menaquinone biosynthesis C-methylase UbiE